MLLYQIVTHSNLNRQRLCMDLNWEIQQLDVWPLKDIKEDN
jgi:hypothetical protein